MESIDRAPNELRKSVARSKLSLAILAAALVVSFAGISSPAFARNKAGTGAGAAAQNNETRASSGKALYGSACVFCHGVDGKGAAAPALNNLSLSPKAVAEIVANGKTGTAMPAFKGRYSQSQIGDLVAYVLSLSSPSGSAAATPAKLGETIYVTKCASCHEAGNPPFFNHLILKTMSPDYILYQLKSGPMRLVAAKLTIHERVAVAEYLTGKRAGSSRPRNPSAGRCSGPAPQDLSGPEWNGWGIDYDNSRFQPGDQAGLTAAQVPNLKLKWAFGFPGDWGAFAQPVIVGGRVFFGGPMGVVYSLDAKTGCTYWRFQADAGVRSAVVIGPDHLAYFGDFRSNVYALNALTGKLVWKSRITTHPYARVSDSPRLYKGHLYVGVSSREEWMAADPHYECCTFRGVLVSFDAATGREIWRSYTIPDAPRPTKKSPDGTQLWGPSGGGLWSSPTVDEKKQLLYVGVGDNYSDPPTTNSDAIMAIDMKTGKIAWSNQLTSGDAFNTSCLQNDKSNCPKKPGGDYDFASPPLLRTLPNGQRLLIVSQKSSAVLAVDPDQQGKLVWQTKIGQGGPLGGVEWGPAADAKAVYEALSDIDVIPFPGGLEPDSKKGGGLFALDIATGKQIWAAPPVLGTCHVDRCSPAQSAAVTAIPGVIFSGSDDGHIRAYSADDGKIIWDFDTLQNFKTVNQVPAHGGSIDGGGGPTVVGGMVYVSSGYGALWGMPGNVFLAFAPQ
jgi:polyvinyl alcohol dehydrogenase (cytochrome)